MTTIFGQISKSENIRPIQNIAERAPSPEEADRRMMDHLSAKIRVAIPARVVSFNASKQTIVAQPLIREKIIDRANGNVKWVTLPQILDVPVQFPQGGDYVLTMPLQPGDEVQLQFNDLNIDSWFTSGGIQNWNDKRRHDLSDAVAIPGINSQPNVIPDISTDSTELRSKDGAVKVRVRQTKLAPPYQALKTSTMTLVASGYKLQSGIPTPYTNGIVIDENGVSITGKLIINGFEYLNHKHADPVSGTTGPVIP
jgi:hypothetical protein